jgi:hypothetical protein
VCVCGACACVRVCACARGYRCQPTEQVSDPNYHIPLSKLLCSAVPNGSARRGLVIRHRGVPSVVPSVN